MKLVFLAFSLFLCPLKCANQEGPDPWHSKNDASLPEKENIDVTPDLRMPMPPKRNFQSQNAGIGDWFFKRILAIVLKGGQFKVSVFKCILAAPIQYMLFL